jgi:large subunit ribosomal protein L24
MSPKKLKQGQRNAPLHRKRKRIAAHLAEDLLTKYNQRSVSIVKGDTVKIMRGGFKGHSNKVIDVNTTKHQITVEGITTTKADGTKVVRPIHSSNVLITKLNLTDPWRRTRLETGLEEEVKKEIEKEAEEQLKVIEQEREAAAKEKAEEEERKKEEEMEEEERKKEEEMEEEERKKEEEMEGEELKKPRFDFVDIPGVGEKTAEKLKKAGIAPDELLDMSIDTLADVDGIGKKTAERILEGLKELGE